MENCVGTKKSISGNKDVFDNTSPFNWDHIWPLSQGGTDANINKLRLSKKSNDAKKDKTSGEINEKRFAIEKRKTQVNSNGEQTVYGELYIEEQDGWYLVEN